MTKKIYRILTLVVLLFLGSILAFATFRGLYLLPLISFPAAVIVLLLAKRFVRGVYEDERDYYLFRKASSWAFIIFSMVSAVVLNIFLALGEKTGNSHFTVIGVTLSLALCFLMLVYFLAYLILRRKS